MDDFIRKIWTFNVNFCTRHNQTVLSPFIRVEYSHVLQAMTNFVNKNRGRDMLISVKCKPCGESKDFLTYKYKSKVLKSK